MSKKYFITSDVHSFFKPFKKALWDAGFRKTNPNHILVICGDVFDRGLETIKLYEFIMSIPKERRILIKGNHEYLYEELLNKDFPESHDFHNGTVSTFCQIANNSVTPQQLKNGYYFRSGTYFDIVHIEEEEQAGWDDVKQKVKDSPITAWIQSDEWIDYFEIKNYILVHSFIPLNRKNTKLSLIISGKAKAKDLYEYNPNWRSEKKDWLNATWGCPWEMYQAGLFEPEEKEGKVLVCGHWHTSDFYKNLDSDNTHDSRCDIYFGKGIIALDACTAISNRCNVLIIEE